MTATPSVEAYPLLIYSGFRWKEDTMTHVCMWMSTVLSLLAIAERSGVGRRVSV